MIRSSALTAFFLLAACADGRADAGVSWKSSYTPAECRRLTSYESIVARCGDGDVDRAMQRLSTDESLCLPFSDPRKMEGIWLQGFELSNFYEGAADYSQIVGRNIDLRETATWFSTTGRANEKLLRLPQAQDGQAFHVEIVGKKSLCEGSYGHLGYALHQVIATDLLRITPLDNHSER